MITSPSATILSITGDSFVLYMDVLLEVLEVGLVVTLETGHGSMKYAWKFGRSILLNLTRSVIEAKACMTCIETCYQMAPNSFWHPLTLYHIRDLDSVSRETRWIDPEVRSDFLLARAI